MQRTYQLADIAPLHAHQAMVTLLSRAGRRQSYGAGATIAKQGDTADGFWLIETGKICVCRFGAQGHVTVFGILGPGDILGELACLSGVRRQVDSIAEEAATLIWIDRTLMAHLLDTEPAFSQWMISSLAAQLRTALDRIERQHQLPATGRLAQVLTDLAKRHGPEIGVSQQELADYIGVSRVTLGHALKKLAAQGLLRIGYRRVHILALERLQGLA